MAKNVVITGASNGIGKAAAESLDTQNYNLFIVGHNPEKTKNVAENIGAKYFTVDFASLDSVYKLAKQIKKTLGNTPLDILVNNAGIFSQAGKTIDGFEKTFQVNYLGPFLLTNLFLTKLLAAKGVVINTSSFGNLFGRLNINNLNGQKKFRPIKAHGDSKLAVILMTKELHRRYHRKGLSAVAFHPGIIASHINQTNLDWSQYIINHYPLRLILNGPKKSGKLLDWFITGTPDITWISGRYYDKYKLTDKVNPQANNLNLQKKLWDKSLKLSGLND